MILMVTPQQRKQVIVKSIGEIERESTVRARPMGSRKVENMARAAAFGNSVGEGIGGVKEIVSGGWDKISTAGGWYSTFSKTKANWLLIGLAYGNDKSRRFVVPQRDLSWVGNVPNYVFTVHVLSSTVMGLLGMRD